MEKKLLRAGETTVKALERWAREQGVEIDWKVSAEVANWHGKRQALLYLDRFDVVKLAEALGWQSEEAAKLAIELAADTPEKQRAIISLIVKSNQRQAED